MIRLLLLTIAFAGAAGACECIRPLPQSRADVMKNASVAFVGWPVSVRCVFEGEDVIAFDYVFEVVEAWLPVARRVTIRTGFSTCGFVFEPDVDGDQSPSGAMRSSQYAGRLL